GFLWSVGFGEVSDLDVHDDLPFCSIQNEGRTEKRKGFDDRPFGKSGPKLETSSSGAKRTMLRNFKCGDRGRHLTAILPGKAVWEGGASGSQVVNPSSIVFLQ
ncbi:MAG: hypothetical protein D6694_06865, partial [Gammaproteobacteria bacterium]